MVALVPLCALSAVTLFSTVFAENLCHYGWSRYLGPLEEEEEYVLPDAVRSSIAVQDVNGAPADPKDALIAGKRLTFSKNEWDAAGHLGHFDFEMYRGEGETSAFKRISTRISNVDSIEILVSDDGKTWKSLKKTIEFGKWSTRFDFSDRDCKQDCNGVVGQYLRVIFRGGETVPEIESFSIIGCEAFRGSRQLMCAADCGPARTLKPNDVTVSTNVKVGQGAISDIMTGKTVTFDKDDWEKKKNNAYIQFNIEGSTEFTLLNVFLIYGDGFSSATLQFSMDPDSDNWASTVRGEYTPWDGGVGFVMTDYGDGCEKDEKCSGIVSPYLRVKIHGKDGEVPSISKPFIKVTDAQL